MIEEPLHSYHADLGLPIRHPDWLSAWAEIWQQCGTGANSYLVMMDLCFLYYEEEVPDG